MTPLFSRKRESDMLQSCFHGGWGAKRSSLVLFELRPSSKSKARVNDGIPGPNVNCSVAIKPACSSCPPMWKS